MDNPKLIQALKDGKPPIEYIPLQGMEEIAWVMKSGADKYGRFNWRIDKIKSSTYIASIFRHAMLEWAQGTNEDKDSGRHPLAHVAAACLIVMDAEKHGTLIDDRGFAESLDKVN